MSNQYRRKEKNQSSDILPEIAKILEDYLNRKISKKVLKIARNLLLGSVLARSCLKIKILITVLRYLERVKVQIR
jgi:hypothetical protein